MLLIPNWKQRCAGRLQTVLLAALIPLYLTSCAPSLIAPLPVVERVMPEQSCLAPADPLPTLTDPSYPALIRLLVDVANEYWILAARHKCLADFANR